MQHYAISHTGVSSALSGKSRLSPGRSQAGFTLIELLVVTAIIVILTGVVLSRYSSYNSTVLLHNLAYDIALSIREAQVLGVSVRGTSGDFDEAYGVYFTANSTEYVQFYDTNKDLRCSRGDEVVSRYSVDNGNKIGALTVEGTDVYALCILFSRPEPDAILNGYSDTSLPSSPRTAQITVESQDGTRSHTVTVYTTGQISID